MEDKEVKRKLKKIPDADENGDPIYKIAETKPDKTESDRKKVKS